VKSVETFVGLLALAGLAMISGPVTASGDPVPRFDPCPLFLPEALRQLELHTEPALIDNVYCVGRVSEEDPLGDHAVYGVAYEDLDTGNVWVVVNHSSDEMGEPGWEAWLADNGWDGARPTRYGYTTAP
jgi:hypothetical protein